MNETRADRRTVSQSPLTHNARMSCATASRASLLWRMPTPRRHSQTAACVCSMRLLCASLACTTRPYPQPPRLLKSTRRTSTATSSTTRSQGWLDARLRPPQRTPYPNASTASLTAAARRCRLDPQAAEATVRICRRPPHTPTPRLCAPSQPFPNPCPPSPLKAYSPAPPPHSRPGKPTVA